MSGYFSKTFENSKYSSLENTEPLGLFGEFNINILVLSVIADSN